MRRVPRSIQKGIQVADRQIVKFKYMYNGLTTGAIPIQTLQFNLNSLYDPDATGTGHQPTGYDQWTNFYNRYRVFSCAWRVSITSAMGLPSLGVVIYPSNVNTVATSLAQAAEQRWAKFKQVQSDAYPLIVRGKTYLPTLVGATGTEYRGSDRYQAGFGASPSEVCILNIFMESVNGTSSVICDVAVELWYVAELFDRNQLALS